MERHGAGPFVSCSRGECRLGQRRSLSLGGGQVGGERAARCPVKCVWGGDGDTQDEAW